MRAGIIGFLLGAGGMLLAGLLFQQVIIRNFAEQIEYRFNRYVFYTQAFPPGYIAQGRLIRTCLSPVFVTTTFYDSNYQVVTEAKTVGRYGAVVRIAFWNGFTQHRFITLYRTPQRVFWANGSMSASAQLPPEVGLDPIVLNNQGGEIGEVIKNSFFGDGDVSPDLAILLSGLSETSPRDPPAVDRTNVNARDAKWWFGLRQRLGLLEKYPHLVDLPHGYDTDPEKRWPLILYLHGVGEKGYDLRKIRDNGLAGAVARGKDLSAIVVTPQCPRNQDWDVATLFQLLDEVGAQYRVDSERIYLTGVSAGGDAVWAMALEAPDRFAAIVPIAGESDPADAVRLKALPIWAFQGLKDDIVPPSSTINMVNATRKAGGHPHLTAFPELGHNASDPAYEMDALYTWLLAQKRGQPEVVTPGVP